MPILPMIPKPRRCRGEALYYAAPAWPAADQDQVRAADLKEADRRLRPGARLRALSCPFAQEPQEPHASRPSAAPWASSVRLMSLLFAAFSAAMLGLAAGAVWMLPTMALQRPLPALALVAGWLLALAVQAWVRPAGRVAAALAAGATVLAAIYVEALTAAARIAGAMGIGLLDALREAGPSMLLALARLAMRPTDLAFTLAGALLAAWVAARRRKA
jgi:vitamin B12 transport system permease protein